MLEKHRIQSVLGPLWISVVMLILVRRATSTVADPDLWGYMAFGRLFWGSRSFPYHDIFTYLPTYARWIYHEWLTGVLFYPVYRLTGGFGLVVLRDLAALATLGFLYLAARIRKGSSASVLLWLALVHGFLTIGYGSVIRAQVFTYLFTAITLYLLEKSREGRWSLLLILVPIQILWCNLHGGFLAGLGIIAIYGVGEAFSRRRWWPYLTVFILSVLATLINPYGIDYWTYMVRAVALPRSEITEWASIFTAYARHDITLKDIFYYAFVALLSLRIVIWARWREITPILLLSVTFLLGIKHVRHEVFFLMLVAVYLPELFQRYIGDLQTLLANVRPWLKEKAPIVFAGSRRMAAFFLAVPVLFLCASPGPSSFSLSVPSEQKAHIIIYYPGRALEYIKGNYSEGNILTEFGWGEYLLWNLGPHMKVALDGRYETVYQDRVANEYFDYMKGKENGFLGAYAHELVLLRPDSIRVASIRSSPDWKVAYEDKDSILFTKVRTGVDSQVPVATHGCKTGNS